MNADRLHSECKLRRNKRVSRHKCLNRVSILNDAIHMKKFLIYPMRNAIDFFFLLFFNCCSSSPSIHVYMYFSFTSNNNKKETEMCIGMKKKKKIKRQLRNILAADQKNHLETTMKGN